jgi:hypothetical protein
MAAGYSARSLVDKLGLKTGMSALVINPSDSLLSQLPDDVRSTILQRCPSSLAKPYDYIHLFTADQANLQQSLPLLKSALNQDGMLWVSWPKKAAKKIANIVTDLSENIIRDHAIAMGLVDVKVCAIDEVWSGLKLVIPVKYRTRK